MSTTSRPPACSWLPWGKRYELDAGCKETAAYRVTYIAEGVTIRSFLTCEEHVHEDTTFTLDFYSNVSVETLAH